MFDNAEVYIISVAANLADVHMQTLRNYDRLELVTPQRTSGGGRRYTKHDMTLLREIQRLNREDGVDLAGTKVIIDLTEQVDSPKQENAELREWLYQVKIQARRPRGELVRVPRSAATVM